MQEVNTAHDQNDWEYDIPHYIGIFSAVVVDYIEVYNKEEHEDAVRYKQSFDSKFFDQRIAVINNLSNTLFIKEIEIFGFR